TAAFIKNEVQRWGEVIRANHIMAEGRTENIVSNGSLTFHLSLGLEGAMSALPRTADSSPTSRHVRFVPKPNSCIPAEGTAIQSLAGEREHHRRHANRGSPSDGVRHRTNHHVQITGFHAAGMSR